MRVISLDDNKKVTSTKTVLENYILQAGEILSSKGEVGQIQQIDGSFLTPTPTPITPKTYIDTDTFNEAIAELSLAIASVTPTTTS